MKTYTVYEVIWHCDARPYGGAAGDGSFIERFRKEPEATAFAKLERKVGRMTRLLLALLLSGCAAQVSAPVESVCLTHTHDEFLHGTFACVDATAPKCAFDANGEPTELAPNGLVHDVCTCQGGVYACWGHD